MWVPCADVYQCLLHTQARVSAVIMFLYTIDMFKTCGLARTYSVIPYETLTNKPAPHTT